MSENQELFANPEDPQVKRTVFTCPKCGEEIVFEKALAPRRGMLAGLSLEEMDDEQLKRELINSKSVLYKAQQRGANIETISKNAERVAAAEAEKAKRVAAKAPVEPATQEPATQEAPQENTEI